MEGRGVKKAIKAFFELAAAAAEPPKPMVFRFLSLIGLVLVVV